MIKKTVFMMLLLAIVKHSFAQTTPWNGKACAVVLTYDDAINDDLDYVVPALDSLNLKGTFYLTGSSIVLYNRTNEWRAMAANGHELGNHTMFHPCDGSIPNRPWVTPDSDLRNYTLTRAVSEVTATNTMLKAIDGKTIRTFAYPCGDLTVAGNTFFDKVMPAFVAGRGVAAGRETLATINLANVKCYVLSGQSADYMINLVNQAKLENKLIVFLFHSVKAAAGASVNINEHSKLLHYLKANEANIWVASMLDVANYVKTHR